jgi:hypothetical protein
VSVWSTDNFSIISQTSLNHAVLEPLQVTAAKRNGIVAAAFVLSAAVVVVASTM